MKIQRSVLTGRLNKDKRAKLFKPSQKRKRGDDNDEDAANSNRCC